MQWPDEQASNLARLNNDDAAAYQETEDILDDTELINFAIENRLGDSDHSDAADY